MCTWKLQSAISLCRGEGGGGWHLQSIPPQNETLDIMTNTWTSHGVIICKTLRNISHKDHIYPIQIEIHNITINEGEGSVHLQIINYHKYMIIIINPESYYEYNVSFWNQKEIILYVQKRKLIRNKLEPKLANKIWSFLQFVLHFKQKPKIYWIFSKI